MTNIQYYLSQFSDGMLTIGMAPPQPIGGWSIRLEVLNAFGGMSGLIQKYCASGYNGVSGITVVNSGEGIMQVQFNSPDTSGMNYGNYPIVVEALQSGGRTPICEGYFTLGPAGGP
jgi:hypothetical protein